MGLALMPRDVAVRLGLPVPERGLRVERVYPDGPADRAGLQTDDAVVAIDGRAVATLGDVFRALAGRKAGDRVTLTIERRGVRHTVGVALALLPQVGRGGHAALLPRT